MGINYYFHSCFCCYIGKNSIFSRNEKAVGNTFKEEILSLVANKKIDEARNLCASKKSCVASAVKKFLEKAEKGMEVQDYEFILKEITIQENFSL